MLWENCLTKLRKENESRIMDMSSDMGGQLSFAIQQLSSSAISLFEQEVVKKDLIGFAEEAELQKVTLEQKFGMPTKEFCEFLIRDRKKDKVRLTGEHLLELVVRLTLWVTFFGWLNVMTGEHTLDGMDFLLSVFCTIGSDFIGNSIWQYKGKRIYDQKKWGMQVTAGVIVFVILSAVVSRYPVVLPMGESPWMTVCAFFAGALVLLVLRNCYWNVQSKKYQ